MLLFIRLVAAGTLFGVGVTMSAIARGNKDGELNHAIGALCASSVLAMRGTCSSLSFSISLNYAGFRM